ncbi:hypothetical protein FRX31_010289 [Thalictrum thalictroides]|uniref:Uncharacterized protein n=1 Tax=Thalictrum thalictroides TaxID=46969 RepID=A0A7J6WRY8_THATH|nr:hypothetical protein FRX31_010289 [Thalictrum thalictroides]
MFPFNPYYPPFLNAYCVVNGSQPPIILRSTDDVSSTKELAVASHAKPEDASLDSFELVDPHAAKCLILISPDYTRSYYFFLQLPSSPTRSFML